MGVGGDPTDLSNNSGTDLRPAPKALNGTYNTALFAEEAARLKASLDAQAAQLNARVVQRRLPRSFMCTRGICLPLR